MKKYKCKQIKETIHYFFHNLNKTNHTSSKPIKLTITSNNQPSHKYLQQKMTPSRFDYYLYFALIFIMQGIPLNYNFLKP